MWEVLLFWEKPQTAQRACPCSLPIFLHIQLQPVWNVFQSERKSDEALKGTTQWWRNVLLPLLWQKFQEEVKSGWAQLYLQEADKMRKEKQFCHPTKFMMNNLTPWFRITNKYISCNWNFLSWGCTRDPNNSYFHKNFCHKCHWSNVTLLLHSLSLNKPPFHHEEVAFGLSKFRALYWS